LTDDDLQRFARLYDEHVWGVYGFFGYRLASREQAEDLTQLTFERALRAWGRFDERRGSARTWLLAIARNLLTDHYRGERAGREMPLPDGDPDAAWLGSEPPEERGLGLSPELETALQSLGQRERELIALRFGADLTGPEIAEITDLTVPNVQQIMSRSLRRLRAELEGGRATSVAAKDRTRR
jgi:RNA polymerase sigma-70 factor, ECF subfamily